MATAKRLVAGEASEADGQVVAELAGLAPGHARAAMEDQQVVAGLDLIQQVGRPQHGDIAGAMAMIFFYVALSLGEVSVVKPIAFSIAPAVGVLLGWIVLGESMDARKAIAVALIVAGVVILTTGGGGAVRGDGAAAAAQPR